MTQIETSEQLAALYDRHVEEIVERVLARHGTSEAPHVVLDTSAAKTLTYREIEILSLAAGGKSNKEIARALKISDQTVKNHLTSAFAKLNANDRTQAVVSCIQRGIISI